jgi:hypothetical protein
MALREDSVLEGKVLRLEEQVPSDSRAAEIQVTHLKCRKDGEFRDVPAPKWLQAKIRAHVEEFGITKGGYLFPNRLTSPRVTLFRRSFKKATGNAYCGNRVGNVNPRLNCRHELLE